MPLISFKIFHFFTMKNMQNVHLSLLLSFVVASFSFSGCGGERLPPDLPKLFTISVTVEQEGNPVPGAVVTLNHLDGDAKWSATCETGSDGIAKNFVTNGKYKGVAAGKFQVCVRKYEQGTMEKVDLPPEPTDPYERYQWRLKYNESQQRSESYDLIEPKYWDPRLSTLEVEVTTDGKNEFTVDAGKPVQFIFQR